MSLQRCYDVNVVKGREEIDYICNRIIASGCTYVAFDTETTDDVALKRKYQTSKRNGQYNMTSIIQIMVGHNPEIDDYIYNTVFIFQLTPFHNGSPGMDSNKLPWALAKLLQVRHIAKVGFGVQDDFRKLSKEYPKLNPGCVIDLCSVATLYGMEKAGMRSLTEFFFSPDDEQKTLYKIGTDWDKEVLDEESIEYAANDVHLIRQIVTKMLPFSGFYSSLSETSGVQEVSEQQPPTAFYKSPDDQFSYNEYDEVDEGPFFYPAPPFTYDPSNMIYYDHPHGVDPFASGWVQGPYQEMLPYHPETNYQYVNGGWVFQNNSHPVQSSGSTQQSPFSNDIPTPYQTQYIPQSTTVGEEEEVPLTDKRKGNTTTTSQQDDVSLSNLQPLEQKSLYVAKVFQDDKTWYIVDDLFTGFKKEEFLSDPKKFEHVETDCWLLIFFIENEFGIDNLNSLSAIVKSLLEGTARFHNCEYVLKIFEHLKNTVRTITLTREKGAIKGPSQQEKKKVDLRIKDNSLDKQPSSYEKIDVNSLPHTNRVVVAVPSDDKKNGQIGSITLKDAENMWVAITKDCINYMNLKFPVLHDMSSPTNPTNPRQLYAIYYKFMRNLDGYDRKNVPMILSSEHRDISKGVFTQYVDALERCGAIAFNTEQKLVRMW